MKIKNILLAAAALVAAACSTDSVEEAIVTPKSDFEISATQVADPTRVAIENGKQVSWVEGDAIYVRSTTIAATATASEVDGATARFKGEGEPQDIDTYWATYPAKAIEGSSVSYDLKQQNGKAADAALLVGRDEDTQRSDVNIEFRPINSLLYVVADFAVAEAQFSSFSGQQFATTFSYDFQTDTTTLGEASADAITVSNIGSSEFFISLPAGLDMTAESGHDGYILTLTNAEGQQMVKAYDGQLFEGGKTTAINLKWSQPAVTIGARTSYSYYDEGNSQAANSCANNVVYFSQDSGCAMTYSGIQNAFISDLAIVYGGTTYKYSEGNVMWDKSSKSFSIANQSVSALGSYDVEAYIVTTYGATIAAPKKTLYITGLPYTLNPAANDEFNAWAVSDTDITRWGNTDKSYTAVRLGYAVGTSLDTGANTITKNLSMPASTKVSVVSTGGLTGSRFFVSLETEFTLTVGGSELVSSSANGNNSYKDYSCNTTVTIPSGSQTIVCRNSNSTNTACSYVGTLVVTYGNK